MGCLMACSMAIIRQTNARHWPCHMKCEWDHQWVLCNAIDRAIWVSNGLHWFLLMAHISISNDCHSNKNTDDRLSLTTIHHSTGCTWHKSCCSASHVHEECPAPRRNTGIPQSLNGCVESVRYVIEVKVLPLKQNLVETVCKPRPILVTHKPVFRRR
jgi:hypothetical protein